MPNVWIGFDETQIDPMLSDFETLTRRKWKKDMTVAAPFIDPSALLTRAKKTPKELLEERLAKKVIQLEANVKEAKRVFDQRENELKKFISEVENCFNEAEVKQLCANLGL